MGGSWVFLCYFVVFCYVTQLLGGGIGGVGEVVGSFLWCWGGLGGGGVFF